MTTTYTYDERIVSDLHKEVYGFRPTSWWFQEWKAAGEDAKQAIWDGLCEAHEAEMAAERERHARVIKEFEDLVLRQQEVGAPDRQTAIRWIVDSLNLSQNDLLYGADYVCYCLGLPYSCSSMFIEAVELLRQKETA